MYRALIGFLAVCAGLFYDRRRIGELTVPASGPLVLVGNHPNGLVDPILVAGTTGRRLRFLAKEPLFRMPMIGLAVRGVGALPVHRAHDGGAAEQNDRMFGAVAAALHEGDGVALFPEGTTHDGSELTELRTGAARMVLAAEAAHAFGLGVQVVAVGLTYEDKARFRSSVTVEVGPAQVATDLAEAYAADPRAAVRDLTERIEQALRAVTLNLDAWADLAPVRLAAELTDPGDPVRGARRIGTRLSEASDSGPAGSERADALRARLSAFGARLRQLQIPVEQLDGSLDGNYALVGVVRFALRNLVAIVLGSSVALVGAVAYVVPYELHRLVVRLVRPTQVLAATVKVPAGVVLFLPWQVVLLLLAAHEAPWWVAVPLTWLLLPAAGVYAVRFLARRQRALLRARLFVLTLRRPPLLTALRTERDGMLADLAEIAQPATP